MRKILTVAFAFRGFRAKKIRLFLKNGGLRIVGPVWTFHDFQRRASARASECHGGIIMRDITYHAIILLDCVSIMFSEVTNVNL